MQRIVVGTDGSAISLIAVTEAAKLAAATGATLRIACAVRSPQELLVLGSSGMKGAARFLLGSVPDRCAHHAPCSVMIVRTV